MDFAGALKDLDSLNHAYLLEGGENMRDALLAHLSAIKFDAIGHPDAFIRTYESFGIDEGREVTTRSSRKPVVAPRNIFVLTTPSMTAEAQNTLLKTFEEPSSVATFFLIMPSTEALLSTLRSRMQQLAIEGIAEEAGAVSAADFLAASPAKRIKLIEPILKERKVGEVIAFLSDIESVLAARDLRDGAVARGLQAVYRARSFGADKGALLKVLLEQVALLAP